MEYMRNTLRLLGTLSFSLLLLASCGELDAEFFQDEFDYQDENKAELHLFNLNLSEDNRTITLSGNLDGDCSGILFTGENSCFTVHELAENGDTLSPKVSATFAGMRGILSERYDSLRLALLVMVDLTLPQEVVDAERKALSQLKMFYDRDNLFVCFLRAGGEVSETMLFNDYIFKDAFVSRGGSHLSEDNIDKLVKKDSIGGTHLYAGIIDKLTEMDSGSGVMAEFRNKVLLIMSNGAVWGEEVPYDDCHFDTQERLLECLDNYNYGIPVIFSYFGDNIVEEAGESITAQNNILKLLCGRTHGMYQERYDWVEYRDFIAKTYRLPTESWVFTLQNPDGKVYSGQSLSLHVDYCDCDSIVVSGKISYRVGNKFFPIVVNGENDEVVLVRSIVIWIVILIVLYIVFQFVEPSIQYSVFKRKYVTRYRYGNMVFNGRIIPDTCYSCKAPFRTGDTIVAKCEHVMHKECWNENGYHCPEYGPHCRQGAHYYNEKNRFDWRNTPFYASWVLTAVSAGILSLLVLSHVNSFKLMDNLVMRMLGGLHAWSPEDPERLGHLYNYMAFLQYVPSYVFYLAFFIVLFISFLAEYHYHILRRLAHSLLRALLAAILSSVIWLGCVMLSTTFNYPAVFAASAIMGVILVTLVILLAISIGTRVQIKLKFTVLAIALVMVNSFVWSFVSSSSAFDYRFTAIYVHVIYFICIALSVATAMPHSFNYYLHVTGAVKAMDIALAKWFKYNSNAVVSIGRSVACSIQLSWDIKSRIAPIQAEIYSYGFFYYLRAKEDGVFLEDGKMLDSKKRLVLYHGTRFRIGDTSFEFVECDLERKHGLGWQWQLHKLFS